MNISKMLAESTTNGRNRSLRGLLIHAAVGAVAWTSTTDMTEKLYGTSGRGNSNFAEDVRRLARMGFLETYKRGRAQYFRAPEALVEWAKTQPDYAEILRFNQMD